MEQNIKTSIKECYEIAGNGLDCLIYSYEESTNSFDVVIWDGEKLCTNSSPNTTTSAIGYRTTDCRKMKLVPYELEAKFKKMEKMVTDARKNILERETIDKLYEALPLRSFDVMPAFSTAKLFLFIGGMTEEAVVFNYPIFYICLRSVLQYCNGDNILKLHPVVLYHCYKGLENTYALTQIKGNKINEAKEKEFKKCIEQIGKKINIAGKFKEYDFYKNIGLCDNIINDNASKIVKNEGGAIELSKILKKIVTIAYHNCVDITASYYSNRSRPIDPSALAYSTLIISESRGKDWGGKGEIASSHKDISLKSLEVCSKSCTGGIFSGMRPFYEDDKGRYLVLDSVGVATGLCFATLALKDEINNNLLMVLVDIFNAKQHVLKNELIEIETTKNDKTIKLHGWYCDNALTKDRIDSWVTSHAVKFLLGKAAIEKLSYQREILKKYDVMPVSKNRKNKFN